MTILALEFSSDRRSVAVVRDGRALAESFHNRGRATPAFTLITRVLEEASLRREEVECIAIGLGPGSYTGVRLAISAAQGWHMATGIRIAAVSSFDALALKACAHPGPPVSFIADAQRNEFAIATAEPGPNGFRWRTPLHLESHDSVWERIRQGDRIAGPQSGLAERGGVEQWPSAIEVGILVQQRNEFVAPGSLAPIYLREASFVKAPAPRSVGKLPP